MKLSRFTAELATLIADELRARADQLRPLVLRCVALDVHPWHGRISLAILTSDDVAYSDIKAQREDMAAWSGFALTAAGDSPWPRADALAAAMRAEYEVHRDAGVLLSAAASALDAAEVTAVLAGFELAPTFERFVGDPDDPDQNNLCAG